MKGNAHPLYDQILKNCESGWIRLEEIEQIYSLLASSNIPDEVISHKLPHRPEIGSLCLVRKTDSHKFWKRDGYAYEKRPNGRGFKESSERIGRDKSILCLYSQIDRKDEIYAGLSASEEARGVVRFQRRIYAWVKPVRDVLIVQYWRKAKDGAGRRSLDQERGKLYLKKKGRGGRLFMSESVKGTIRKQPKQIFKEE